MKENLSISLILLLLTTRTVLMAGSQKFCDNLIVAVRGESSCSVPRKLQRQMVVITGNGFGNDAAQMRVGRAANGGYERMGRAVIRTLQTVYEECMKATDNIRFKRRPLDNFYTPSDMNAGPSCADLIREVSKLRSEF